MDNQKAIAVVGMGAILPDALDVASFWNNILNKKSSIGEVPAERWSTELYYDPDPKAVDKTYSKIGAFVRDYQFDPFKAGMAIPPRVLALMDPAQQWGLAAAHQALKDYGYPERHLNPERVAVILGNALAGEGHYRSTFRLLLPEYLASLESLPDFKNLPAATQNAILAGITGDIQSRIPVITEDTMPGELANIIAGRIANVFNFSGPNFVTDAACASSLAALQAAVDGLANHHFDAVLCGGVDRNMGPESFIKFSKIGALSAEGSRPYSDKADGFVMGEGAVIFLLKRLEDAERDGDKIYALIRGIGGSSDGKGKGITAPNPLGQQRAIERALTNAGVSPESVGLIEGHGTSTKVGDVAEVGSLKNVFGSYGLTTGSIALGSVKSNIGHLKSAAGAAGLLKTILALNEKVLP
ncbi:polyketide synthase, partial [bacterium]|nr:polyketide synthase [bacterium]